MELVKAHLVIVLLALSIFAQGVWTPERQVLIKPIGSVRTSSDGGRVVYTVSEAVMTPEKSEFVSQIWLANADGTGASQLTAGERSSTNPKWSPDGVFIAFTSTRKTTGTTFISRMRGAPCDSKLAHG